MTGRGLEEAYRLYPSADSIFMNLRKSACFLELKEAVTTSLMSIGYLFMKRMRRNGTSWKTRHRAQGDNVHA